MSKYKLVYENGKIIKGSYTGIPAAADTEVIDLADYAGEGIKLVYEKDGNIYTSTTGIPADSDPVALTVAQLEGEEGPTPPTPSTLTPFKVNDVSAGIAFNINMSIDEVVAVLEKLTYTTVEGAEMALIMNSEHYEGNPYGELCVMRAPYEGSYMYGILVGGGNGTVFMSSSSEPSITPGWQSRELDENGVYFNGENITVTTLNQDSVWNGIIAGYVEPTPPTPSLTPFMDGTNFDSIYFGDVQNGDLNADLGSFVDTAAQNPGDSGYLELIRSASIIIGVMDFGIMIEPEEGEEPVHCNCLFAMDDRQGGAPTVLYATSNLEAMGVTQGYQNLVDGTYSIDADIVFKINTEYNVEHPFNGVYFGEVMTEDPIVTPLSKYEDGQSYDRMDIVGYGVGAIGPVSNAVNNFDNLVDGEQVIVSIDTKTISVCDRIDPSYQASVSKFLRIKDTNMVGEEKWYVQGPMIVYDANGGELFHFDDGGFYTVYLSEPENNEPWASSGGSGFGQSYAVTADAGFVNSILNGTIIGWNPNNE